MPCSASKPDSNKTGTNKTLLNRRQKKKKKSQKTTLAERHGETETERVSERGVVPHLVCLSLRRKGVLLHEHHQKYVHTSSTSSAQNLAGRLHNFQMLLKEKAQQQQPQTHGVSPSKDKTQDFFSKITTNTGKINKWCARRHKQARLHTRIRKREEDKWTNAREWASAQRQVSTSSGSQSRAPSQARSLAGVVAFSLVSSRLVSSVRPSVRPCLFCVEERERGFRGGGQPENQRKYWACRV